MFHKARLKLTLWYLCIIMLISVMFSITIYRLISNELEREFYRISDRYEREYQLQPSTLDPETAVLQDSEDRVRNSLIYVNLIILGVAGIGGYLLAGITLRPIKTMIDEQNRFITDASHELRTPLTSLKSEIEVYLRGENKTEKESTALLKSNLEEVNKLQYLSDYLIQLAQYSYAKKGTTEKNSLKVILQNAQNKLEKAALQKHITIKLPKNNYYILANKEELTQLFTILIDNAIKYSYEKNTIIISTHKEAHMLSIDVIDTGIGIEKEAIPHIFDRFYRADSSRTKQNIPGYGLGLSIAKNIVQDHHGTITVQSEINKGSTFTVKLPYL